MIVLLALLFRVFLNPPMVQAARQQADKGLVGGWRAPPPWTCR
jgi:hypothetical protein